MTGTETRPEGTGAVPRPLAVARTAFTYERSAGASETEALDVAVHEALRLAGRPIPGTPRKTRHDKREGR